MRKRLLNFGRQYTISTWVITLFVAVIFPINLFLILVTTQYMHSLKDVAVGSGENIIAVYAGNLNNEMSILRNYLFYLEEKEEDFIVASTVDTPGMGRLAYYRIFNLMRDNLTIN